ALYAPGLGYYAAGALRLAAPAVDARGMPLAAGDFVTAPELTPLFGPTVARPAAQGLTATGPAPVLGSGAGTGALAALLPAAVAALGVSAAYRIIDVSADLRARQQARLAPHGARVQWLDALPTSFSGCVLANEVLDAMPVSLFRWSEAGAVLERGVALDADRKSTRLNSSHVKISYA